MLRDRFNAVGLFWRVFLTQFTVLAVIFLLLVFAPVTVSIPVAATELVVLTSGLVAMTVFAWLLLRATFRPLDRVTETMREIDPLAPGQRVPVIGGPNVAALAGAFNDMLDRLESERRSSGRRALEVQENERRRVARELHDEVGQVFTAIILQIESLAARLPDGVAAELDELRETARTGATDVRRIATRLRPEALDDLGLSSALSALTTAFAEHTRVVVDRDLEPVTDLDRHEELVFYRVAQEALTNVARHAEATSVTVALRRVDDAVVLVVRDDGRGLPPGASTSSHGIRGMRERAMLIGADLVLERASPRGTVVSLSLGTTVHG